jgi:antitoxin component YwqK of YwqJK toxin-antitoxin module
MVHPRENTHKQRRGSFISYFYLCHMLRRYLIFLFSLPLSLTLIANAQSDTLNREDGNGWKQGFWIVRAEMLDANPCPAEQKVEEGRYRDNRKVGTWKYFYCSGRVKSEMTYRDDKSAFCKNYYENGILMEEGVWKNGDWTGKYKYYYESGKPFYDFNFDESGKRTGLQKYFHENGNTMIEGEWTEGKESGVIKEYNASGALISEKTFNDGKLDEASVKNYTPVEKPQIKIAEKEPEKKIAPEPDKPLGLLPDGFNRTYLKGTRLVEREGEFRNQQLIEGKIYKYENGQLKKILIIKNGKTVKEEIAPGADTDK